MKRTTKKQGDLAEQVANRNRSPKVKSPKGNDLMMISTGSTLLDLAIGWERRMAGGLPAGILVEIFGPPSSGKTTLLCEIAGGVQRKGGQVLYLDPEGRLNADYAKRLGLTIDLLDEKQYQRPNTVPEAFGPIRKWKPEPDGVVHGVFADSLAALSTDMEMGDTGDKMGMRRAKEFSEELRKSCRAIASQNFLLVCSNQIRQTMNTGGWGEKYKSPGGEAVAFYSSVRLKVDSAEKIRRKVKISGTEVSKVVATKTKITVYKSSVGEPYNYAPVFIDLMYGIDDIRANLTWLKELRGWKTYMLDGEDLGKHLMSAIAVIEDSNLEKQLRREVIHTWHEVQSAFRVERKAKERV